MTHIFRAIDKSGPITDEINVELTGKKLSISIGTHEKVEGEKPQYQSAGITLSEIQTVELIRRLKGLKL